MKFHLCNILEIKDKVSKTAFIAHNIRFVLIRRKDRVFAINGESSYMEGLLKEEENEIASPLDFWRSNNDRK